jgi:hypothetical protein
MQAQLLMHSGLDHCVGIATNGSSVTMKNLPRRADGLASKKGEGRRLSDIANNALSKRCQGDRMEEQHEIRHRVQPWFSTHSSTSLLNHGGEVDGAKVNSPSIVQTRTSQPNR